MDEDETMSNLKKLVCSLIITVFCSASFSADAALIGLQKKWPDVFASGIFVSYDATGDILSALGQASSLQLEDGGPLIPIANGIFDAQVIVDDTGDALSGTLAISGDINIPDLGAVSGPLIIADLNSDSVNFGYGDDPGTYDIIEIRWDVVGGALAGVLFSEFGAASIETIIDADYSNSSTPFTGSWTADFNNSISGNLPIGAGVSDTFVPEPTSFMVMLAAGGLMATRRRRTA